MRVMRRHDLTSDQPKDHDKDKDNEKHNDKYIYRTPSKTAPRDLWPLRFLIRVMRRYNLTNKKRMTKTITMKKTKTMRIEEHPQRAIVETCDLWETDYIFGNWEQQSQHSQWPLNKEWQGQHSQFLRCFYEKVLFVILIWQFQKKGRKCETKYFQNRVTVPKNSLHQASNLTVRGF